MWIWIVFFVGILALVLWLAAKVIDAGSKIDDALRDILGEDDNA